MQPELAWHVPPLEPAELGGTSIAFAAGPRTDLFTDPAGAEPQAGAPLLLGGPMGDFQLKRSRLGQRSRRRSMLLRSSSMPPRPRGGNWRSSTPRSASRTIVSVVTRGVSDDANASSSRSRTPGCASRERERRFAFHASLDGLWWSLVRYFTFDGAGEAAAGLPRSVTDR